MKNLKLNNNLNNKIYNKETCNNNNIDNKLYNNNKFNFNSDDDFSIEFWVKAPNLGFNEEMYLIGKSTTKTVVKSPLEGKSGIYSLSYTGSSQPQDVNAKSSFPFNIFISRKY